MSSSHKQTQLKSRQDTLREEIHLMLGQGRREDAIKHYQSKCGCSANMALAYVEELERERNKAKRDALLAKMGRHSVVYA